MTRLTRDEARELQVWSNTLDFRFDIVGTLPSELVSKIFSSLDLRVAFWARRVSKKWAMILCSEDFMKPLIQPWLTHGDPELLTHRRGQEMKSSSYEHELLGDLSIGDETPKESCSASVMAEHIDAFRSNHPYHIMRGSWSLKNADPESSKEPNLQVAYSRGHLAWNRASHNAIQMFNLKTGKYSEWLLPDRERPWRLAAAESLVAIVTYEGKVLVHNSDSGDGFSSRLPAADARQLTLRDTTLVVLSDTHVFTLSLETRKSCRFVIPYLLPEPVWLFHGVLIASDKQTLTFFNFLFHDTNLTLVAFTRTALNGNDKRPLSSHLIPVQFRNTPGFPYLSDQSGEYTLWSGLYHDEVIRVAYDVDRDIFIYQNFGPDLQKELCPDYFFWKDVSTYHPSPLFSAFWLISLEKRCI